MVLGSRKQERSSRNLVVIMKIKNNPISGFSSSREINFWAFKTNLMLVKKQKFHLESTKTQVDTVEIHTYFLIIYFYSIKPIEVKLTFLVYFWVHSCQVHFCGGLIRRSKIIVTFNLEPFKPQVSYMKTLKIIFILRKVQDLKLQSVILQNPSPLSRF